MSDNNKCNCPACRSARNIAKPKVTTATFSDLERYVLDLKTFAIKPKPLASKRKGEMIFVVDSLPDDL